MTKKGRDIIINYFNVIEKNLIDLSEAAQMPKGYSTGTGKNREYLVSDFLSKHLPGLASVATDGVIIDADTDLKKAQQVDVLIYNNFSFCSRYFPSGHYPAESIYIAIEVKSQKGGITRALEQCANIKQLRKALRPETTYFGYLSPPNKPPDPTVRTGSPTAGIWIWPKKSKFSLNWLDGKIKNFIEKSNAIDVKQLRINMPSCIYVPSKLLAFKIYPNTKNKQTAQYFSEYWFSKDIGETHQLDSDYPFYYAEYSPNKISPPSRLQIFTLWLSHEILKFLHEVPDLFAYAFEKSSLKGRQGYSWKPEAFKVCKYTDNGWEDIRKKRKEKLKS